MDYDKLHKAVRLYLEAIGEDPDREGLKDTPKRVAEAATVLFAGIEKPITCQPTCDPGLYQGQMVAIRHIPFYSVCEHHLLPFFGEAQILYIPSDQGVLGFSGPSKILGQLAARPQLQERITDQLADAIMEMARPQGVLVMLEAQQLCMTMRGLSQPNTRTLTQATRGLLSTSTEKKMEALTSLRLGSDTAHLV